jgi:hypothetical protein
MGARGAASTKAVVEPSLRKPESSLPAISTRDRLFPGAHLPGNSLSSVERVTRHTLLCVSTAER